MNSSIWSDPALLSGLGIVWGLFVVAFFVIVYAAVSTRRMAEVLGSTAHQDLFEPDGSVDAALAGVRRGLRSAVIGRDGARWVLRQEPGELVRRLLWETYANRAGLAFGSAFTGIALIITFVLIALVMFDNVGPAIASSTLSEMDAPSTDLSDAVSRMGAKFFISASGILAALVHRLLLSGGRTLVNRSVEAAADAVAAHAVELDAVRLKNEQTMLAGLAGLSQRVDQGMTQLSGDIGRLSSIEVSVKDLGTQVSSALNQMMKEALAEQLRTLMEDMKLSAEQIEQKVMSFAEAALQNTADQIVSELKGVNDTLKSQAGSQVEKLLEKLQDAVTGGFSAESRNMSTQLAQFGEVIPRLGQQMNEVATRMEGVLDRLANQQEQSTRMMDALADSTRTHADNFAQALSQSGANALGQVMGAASRDVETLVLKLNQVLETSSTSSDATRRNMAEASEAMAASLAETRNTAQALQQQMREIASGMNATAQSGAAMTQTARELLQTIDSLKATVARVGETSSFVGQLLQAQQQTQQKQTELLKAMETVWPPLMGTMTERVRESAQSLGGTWAEASERLEKLAGNQMVQLQESVEELTASVSSLQKTIAAIGQRRVGS